MAADFSARMSRTSYRFMRVSRETGDEVERIGALKGGTVTRNDDTRIKESAEATMVGRYDFGPDLVRVHMDCEWPDGSTADVTLGTFLPVLPSRSVHGPHSRSAVKMYGRLQELLDDKFAVPVTLSRGDNAVAKAREVCEGAGLTVIADPSDFTITDTRAYGVGAEQNNSETDDTKLGMVNDLLDLAGFRAAFTDPMGRVVMRRYAPPEDIAPSWRFIEGPGAKFESDMTDERDYTTIANHVVVRYGTVTDEGGEVIVSEAWDTDPGSDLSTVSRGRVITKSYAYQELPPGKTAEERQEYADNRAENLLRTAQSVIRRVTFTAPYHPVAVNDTVEIAFPTGGVEGVFQIRRQVMKLTGGCPTSNEVRNFWRRATADDDHEG